MQIKAGKLDPELIDKDLIKENLYTSYFLPPNTDDKERKKRGIRISIVGFCKHKNLLHKQIVARL